MTITTQPTTTVQSPYHSQYNAGNDEPVAHDTIKPLPTFSPLQKSAIFSIMPCWIKSIITAPPSTLLLPQQLTLRAIHTTYQTLTKPFELITHQITPQNQLAFSYLAEFDQDYHIYMRVTFKMQMLTQFSKLPPLSLLKGKRQPIWIDDRLHHLVRLPNGLFSDRTTPNFIQDDDGNNNKMTDGSHNSDNNDKASSYQLHGDSVWGILQRYQSHFIDNNVTNSSPIQSLIKKNDKRGTTTTKATSNPTTTTTTTNNNTNNTTHQPKIPFTPPLSQFDRLSPAQLTALSNEPYFDLQIPSYALQRLISRQYDDAFIQRFQKQQQQLQQVQQSSTYRYNTTQLFSPYVTQVNQIDNNQQQSFIQSHFTPPSSSSSQSPLLSPMSIKKNVSTYL